MTTDGPHSPADLEYNALELRRMDEDEARQTLTVDQYERWESIQDLYDEVDETEQQWEQEAETVADVTVSADMEALGTRVDVYGNDLLVHADPEDPDFRDAIERLEGEFGDIDTDDVAADALAEERADEYAAHLLEMLDTVLVKWGETAWADLPGSQREAILQDARGKWGVAGLTRAWGDIAVAIREHHEEVVDEMEKFRDPERRGSR